MSFIYILLAIVLLGLLIMIHELGHFTAARLCGIAVKEYSIGFGPKLIQWKSKKHETVFSVRPIPLGGYCMFYGDETDDVKAEKEDPRNMSNAPVWKRLVTIVSGPLMNLVLAFLVAILLMACYGQTLSTPIIAAVDEGLPAQQAGLRAGDVFVSVNGESMTDKETADVSGAIGQSPEGAPLELVMERDGETMSFEITPFYDEADGRYRIGITIQPGLIPIKGEDIIPAAWNACVNASGAILDALRKLVTTGEGLDQTAGPVGVVQLVAQQTRTGGLEMFLSLMVMISINLGLVNLMPIPGLDGSRLIFLIIEGVRRKPVSRKIESAVHLCGYVFLFGFMIYFTFKDVLRIFGA